MAETFQDRLVTELSLAGTATIDQANAVLQRFRPSFNSWFHVSCGTRRCGLPPAGPHLSLAETLCSKQRRKVERDNTVKYRWCILRLLLGWDRLSYAGVRVEVLERLDCELLAQYRGEDSHSRTPP